jgi:hypothetical protein
MKIDASLLRQQRARAARVLLEQQAAGRELAPASCRGARGGEAVAMGLLRLGSVVCKAPARQHHPIRRGGRTRRSTGRSPRFT